MTQDRSVTAAFAAYATITVRFDSIRVFEDGDALSNGELFGYFAVRRSSGSNIVLFSRPSSNPFDIAGGQVYSGSPTFGSTSFALLAAAGSWFDVDWEFGEDDGAAGFAPLGLYRHPQDFVAPSNSWDGQGVHTLPQGASRVLPYSCHTRLVAPTTSQCTERRTGNQGGGQGTVDIRFYWTVQVN
jgi:hypothetical protein